MSQHNQTNPDVINSSRKSAIGWIFAAILAIICLYLFNNQSNLIKSTDAALREKQQIVDSIKTDRLYLQADFDAASVRIDQLMSQNAGLRDSMQDTKTTISDLQKQIRGILSDKKATREELMKARNLISMLNDKTQAYERHIAEIERDNTVLTGEKKILEEERDATVEQNIALKMTGSVLHASNIRMQLVHQRPNGKEVTTSKAKKVDKILITFDIDENRIAESGTKQIYIRIVGPDQMVMFASDMSGMLNTIQGDRIRYSILKEVDLVKDQPIKNIDAEWPKDIYLKGEYHVELYNGGYKIGQGDVKMK